NTPVIFDATHSVQLPGAGAGVSSGERKYVALLARAAIAAGADGLFIETHPNPDRAISDAATQLPLEKLNWLIDSCLKIRNACLS
ncbi:MAG: 3-deoxy-8-phosphooctulonate synthase, partial [Opitutales bacterium]|nr:3-deoxy-8-phosphooctulonate synthase [Opitutales bacterium]